MKGRWGRLAEAVRASSWVAGRMWLEGQTPNLARAIDAARAALLYAQGEPGPLDDLIDWIDEGRHSGGLRKESP